MRRHVFIIALVAAVVSCDKDPFVGPVDGAAAVLIVYGQVSSADGASIPSAAMSIEARARGLCTNERMDSQTVTTDNDGHYRATLFNWGYEYTVCVNVLATPTSGSGFISDSVQLAPAVMRSTSPDSVRLDVVLPRQ